MHRQWHGVRSCGAKLHICTKPNVALSQQPTSAASISTTQPGAGALRDATQPTTRNHLTQREVMSDAPYLVHCEGVTVQHFSKIRNKLPKSQGQWQRHTQLDTCHV